jgi:alpha-glucoside transport system substrate-binding protein
VPRLRVLVGPLAVGADPASTAGERSPADEDPGEKRAASSAENYPDRTNTPRNMWSVPGWHRAGPISSRRGRILRRRRIALLAGFTALALTVAGCGGGGDDGGSTGNTQAGGETTFADLSGQTVEVAAVWTGAEQEAFKAVLDDFAAKTKATVNYTPTGDDLAAFYGGKIAGGSPPDVGLISQPGLIAEYAQKGSIKPIDDVAGQQLTANYSADWVNLAKVDGKSYGVPFKGATKATMWYNKDVLEQAGVQPPTTWAELKTAAQTISDSGTPAISVGGGDGWTLTDWFENVYLQTAGGEKYDQLVKHEIPWTDDSVKVALEALAQIWGEKDLLAANATKTDFPTSVNNVFAGEPKAGIVYEGDFVYGAITGDKSKADFFTFPALPNSKPSVVGAGDTAVLFKDSAGGKELMKYLATPGAAEIWAAKGGFISPNKNVDLNKYTDPINKRAAEQLVQAETFRFDASDQMPAAFGGTPAKGMWKGLQDFLAKPDDVAGAQKALESAAAAAYK